MAGYLPGLDTTRRAVPSSTDPENPPPAAGLDGDVERQTLTDNNAKVKSFWTKCLIGLAIAACVIVLAMYYKVDAHYSIAIDSAMVLDTKPGLSFNLTLGVASRSHGAEACIDPGMYVEVLSRGVQVATTDAAKTRRTCARPRDVAELPTLAGATMTPVLDNLSVEMGQGAAVFDLRLHTPSWSYSYGWAESCIASCVSDCKGSRIGDPAVPCGSPQYTEQCTYS